MRARPTIALALLIATAPLALAHEDDVLYTLRLAPGAAAGDVAFTLWSDHRFSGIGVGGCTIGSAGVFRVVTPTQNVIEVTLRGLPACDRGVTSLTGDASALPEGQYAGGYAFSLAAPLTIIIYGEG